MVHNQTNNVHPVYEQHPPYLLLIMMSQAVHYLFVQLWSPVPSVLSLNFLCTPTLISGPAGWKDQPSILCKPCSVIMETSPCYQHHFQRKPKTQTHTSYCDENQLYLSWNQHNLHHFHPAHVPHYPMYPQ